MSLFGSSFHSVKGGIGKSHMALRAARWAATREPREPVYLIETSLSGTSLVDASERVRAPRWAGDPPVTSALLRNAPPVGFHDEETTRALIAERSATKEGSPSRVPFLNDFLLYQTDDWDTQHDANVDALCWQLEPTLANLRVIPASPLPRDIAMVQVLVNDEPHSAFIEARLERLLAYIVERHPREDVTVVVDCERGLRGVGGAVLSLGLRLSSSPKQPLAANGGITHPLDESEVLWTAYVLVGADLQDRAAADRWMLLLQPGERDHVQLVQNGWGFHYARKNMVAIHPSLKSSAPNRSVMDVGQGDYVKVGGLWKPILSNSAQGADRLPRHWIVRTLDGSEYGMFSIDRYAKADDLDR